MQKLLSELVGNAIPFHLFSFFISLLLVLSVQHFENANESYISDVR